jgi:hypothetical protein
MLVTITTAIAAIIIITTTTIIITLFMATIIIIIIIITITDFKFYFALLIILGQEGIFFLWHISIKWKFMMPTNQIPFNLKIVKYEFDP